MNDVRNNQIDMENLRQEIREGLWGHTIKSTWDELTEVESDKVIALLYRQLKDNCRSLYFIDAISIIFPFSSCYYHTFDEKFILCLPYPEINRNIHRLRLVADLFLDVTNKYDAYWGRHIGIIGMDKTMQIGKIAIYDHKLRKDL